MIYTSGNELPIAGLSLVLQPTNSSNITPLQTWLSDVEPLPIWIPLSRKNGVNKVLAVASNSGQYAEIIPYIFGQINQRTAVQWQGQPYELIGVEIDRHELHILEISLLASEPLPPSLGRAIHALCFQWLATADAALAERLHNSDLFPFTWLSPKLCDKPNLSTTLHVRQKLWQTLFKGGFARVSVEK